MRRKFQKIIDPIDGDCLRACISTITEIPVSKLPANDKDARTPGGYYEDLRVALARHGWVYIECKIDFWWLYSSLLDVPFVAIVPSQAFPGKRHAVVATYDPRKMSLRIVHDPNPHNAPYDISPASIYSYSVLVRKDGLPALNSAARRPYRTRSKKYVQE